MKYLIVYHANCDDGFGSYWAAQHLLKASDPECDIIAVEGVYGKPLVLPDSVQRTVLILDFSFKPEDMVKLALAGYTVIWIDHHKSAIEAWDSYFELVGNPLLPGNFIDVLSRDNTASGAILTWDYLSMMTIGIKQRRPEFLTYIQDYDLWQFKDQDTKAFKAGLNAMPRTIETWNKFLLLRNIDRCIEQGQAILRYREQLITDIINTCVSPMTIDGIEGLGCNCTYAFASEIGNELAKRSGSFGCTWYENSETVTVFSLRSIGDDCDVSAIATKFGGGGHKNAAGFKLDPLGQAGAVELWSNAADAHNNKEIVHNYGCGPHD